MSGSRPLSTLTGHYDFPPASSSPPGPQLSDSLENLHARLQNIHRRLVEERQDRRAAAETDSFERRQTLEAALMPPSTNLRRPRPSSHDDTTTGGNETPSMGNTSANGNAHNTSLNRDRPRAFPTGRYNRLPRRRQEPERNFNGELQGLEEAGERLAQISSNIEEMLDQQLPLFASTHLPGSPSLETETHQHRTKRRKIESVKSSEFTNHKYGWFGQVEPARLKMEIASCDGGAEDAESTLYRPENVLRKDKSVYHTKRSKCDMVLRHQGETPFSVEKILIKSPEHNFTTPVQEGMVFVSMTSDDLLRRTADYTVDYVPTRTGTPSSPPIPSTRRERLTLLESLRDPIMTEAAHRRYGEDVPPHAQRVATRERRFPTSSSDDDAADNCDLPLENSSAQSGRTAVTTSVDPPTVLTDSEDDWSESEGLSPVYLRDRLAQEGRWPPITEEAEALQYQVIREWREAHRQRRNTARAQGRRRSPPAHAEAEDSSQRPADAQPLMSRDEMIAFNARFRMRDKNRKISIRFDPPLSGKYILIKLWSPTTSGNIDIQSITAYGYSGPRYVPASETR